MTMAAIDPTEEVEDDGQPPRRPRSTLKLIKQSFEEIQLDDDSEDDDEYLRQFIAGSEDEEDGSEDDEDDEANGGPSDPAKSKQALKAAALKKLLDATKDDEEDEDEEMADGESEKKKANGTKAVANGKGKAKATAVDEDENDEDESDEDDELQGLDLQQFTLCTLDTEAVSTDPSTANAPILTTAQHCQQPLELTIGEGEKAFFVNTGTHTIYVTGNYVFDQENASQSDEGSDDGEYDLPPGMDELMDDESEDELDNIDGVGRVEEIDTDEEEEAPKLVQAKKGKNKRAAEDEADGLDDIMAKEEPKLSKKQAKKLKNNEGKAVAAEKDTPKSEKKVQFAKNLEQGPTGSPAEKAKQGDKAKKAGSVRVEKGVTIDDRKVGTGRTAKAGDKVGMRYIGKLEDGKVFDG